MCLPFICRLLFLVVVKKVSDTVPVVLMYSDNTPNGWPKANIKTAYMHRMVESGCNKSERVLTTSHCH